jgi:hypothetical protein
MEMKVNPDRILMAVRNPPTRVLFVYSLPALRL